MHINGVGLAVLCQLGKLSCTCRECEKNSFLKSHLFGLEMEVRKGDYYKLLRLMWLQFKFVFFARVAFGSPTIFTIIQRQTILGASGFFFKQNKLGLFFREELIFSLPSPMHFAGYRKMKFPPLLISLAMIIATTKTFSAQAARIAIEEPAAAVAQVTPTSPENQEDEDRGLVFIQNHLVGNV